MSERLVSFDDLAGLGIHYCRQHLPRMEKKGQFPKRRQIGPGRIAWVASEIDAWIKGDHATISNAPEETMAGPAVPMTPPGASSSPSTRAPADTLRAMQSTIVDLARVAVADAIRQAAAENPLAKPTPNRMFFVYVIEDPIKQSCKIGYSDHPVRRLSELRGERLQPLRIALLVAPRQSTIAGALNNAHTVFCETSR